MYFDPAASITGFTGDLPHWRQSDVVYFVTFRLADSLPQEKLRQWIGERDQWMKTHPEPHDQRTRRDNFERFPQRLQQWLDAGSGSCVLALPEIQCFLEAALRYFDGTRYNLDDFVVAANHVHALLQPFSEWKLSQILHSWKSYTAHDMLKREQVRGVPGLQRVWQKESFDHIVRNPESLERFRSYIRSHREWRAGQTGCGLPSCEEIWRSEPGKA